MNVHFINPGTSVGYELDEWGIGLRFPAATADCFFSKTRSLQWGPPSLLFYGCRASFHSRKWSIKRSKRKADHNLVPRLRIHGVTPPLSHALTEYNSWLVKITQTHFNREYVFRNYDPYIISVPTFQSSLAPSYRWVNTSETSVFFYRTTRRHINLSSLQRANL